jgi:hypothetical protein
VLVPLSKTVTQYEVRRIRACTRAAEILSARAPAGTGEAEKMSRRFETRIETNDGLVGGTIDEIQETDAGAVLRDYKSGYIMKATQQGEATEIDRKYSLQLKLYAALFASENKRWPVRIEIVQLHGGSQVIPFNPSDCEALLSEAVSTLKELNRRIDLQLRSANQGSNETEFANPNPEHCRFCLFRPHCEPYRTRRDLSRDGDWPRDVWGTVSEFRVLGNGRLTLAITERDKKTIRVRGLTATIERHPAVALLREGEDIAIFNLRGNTDRGDLTESQSTVIYLDPAKTESG